MGDCNKKRGRGRPRKIENGYKSDCHVRLSDNEVAMLNTLNIELDIGCSEAIREGLKMFYNIKMMSR